VSTGVTGAAGSQTKKRPDLEKILGVITALLVLATAAFGFWAAKSNSDKNTAQSTVSSQSNDLSALQKQNGSLQSEVASLQARPTPTITITATGGPSTSSGTASSGSAAALDLADPEGQKLITNRYNIDWDTQVAINGKTYPFGYVDGSCFCASRSLDFNLSRTYSLFSARIGARDDSAPGSAQIQVIADGVTLLSKSVTLGTSYDVRVSVKNALRLRLVTIAKSGVIAAFGDPTVTP
jgi:hypothetical protein